LSFTYSEPVSLNIFLPGRITQFLDNFVKQFGIADTSLEMSESMEDAGRHHRPVSGKHISSNFSLSRAQAPKSFTGSFLAVGLLILLVTGLPGNLVAGQASSLQDREQFTRAWEAASHGRRDVFLQLLPTLEDYMLHPYLQYEDLRYRRAGVADHEMATFLETHSDWAFADGLHTAWLKSLGKKKRWDSLISYAGDSGDTEVQCYLAHARLLRAQTDGLLAVAQKLWTVGKSQPDACDPVFKWLRDQDGITPGLAWERIRLAMEARQPRLSLYLARFIPASERSWVERWQQQDRTGYRRLDQAKQWPDAEKSRQITSYGLRRLARSDPNRAWQIYETLEGYFNWSEDVEGAILREIAMWSAVGAEPETSGRVFAVPEAYRDGKLLEWWARFGLATENWAELILVIASMPPDLRNDARWRYWDARAHLSLGDSEYAHRLLGELAREASYYGFLSADFLDEPYSICPQEPKVDQAALAVLRQEAGIRRSMELHRAGLRNWSRNEWQIVTRQLDDDGLRLAAALAIEENWPDLAIFALGNSGDLRWYQWRFPVEYGALAESNAHKMNLDVSWVMGLMRSESAMAEDALSSAGARGLMQLMPDTASQLAKRNSYPYTGRKQLMQAETNILFGTTFLRELNDRFSNNPVLVSGAYNAGPNAVDRWLKAQPGAEPAIWIETIPYFETRDYIPRVLAFATIYDWRLQQPIRRISSRMPAFDSGNMGVANQDRRTTSVACLAQPGPAP
jgi:soluble lytic murein transglycosylase